MAFNETEVRGALMKAWSVDTAVQWTEDNPASGQCNVTAAVVFDLFGGDILKTRLPGVWHYYNRIDGIRCDLTDSQFSAPGGLFSAPETYEDQDSSIEEAMEGIPRHEYEMLRLALLRELGN
ncbi:MAG: hypothetical protein AAGE89_03690 [Pseudomonadota bacterium]